MKRFSSLVDQGLVSGGSFLTIALCARFLTLEEQGIFGYILAAYLGSVIINTTCIFQQASVHAPREQDALSYQKTLASLQALIALTYACLSTIILWLVSSHNAWHFGLQELLLTGGYLTSQALADFDRRSSYVFSNGFQAALSSLSLYPLRICLLITIQPTTLKHTVILLLISTLFPTIRVISKTLENAYNKQFFQRCWAHLFDSRWLIASAPTIWLWSFIPMVALGWLSSVSLVGIFVTIRSLANVGNVLMELLETEVASKAGRIFQSNPLDFATLLSRTLLLGLSIWGAGLFVILAFGSPILTLFFGPRFSEFNNVLLILWLANGTGFLYRLNAVRLRTQGDSKIITMGYTIGVGAMALAAYPAVTIFGVIGGAFLAWFGTATIFGGQLMLTNPRAVTVINRLKLRLGDPQNKSA